MDDAIRKRKEADKNAAALETVHGGAQERIPTSKELQADNKAALRRMLHAGVDEEGERLTATRRAELEHRLAIATIFPDDVEDKPRRDPWGVHGA